MSGKRDDKFDTLLKSVENLRSKLIDLEAIAHSAATIIDEVPYLPRQPRHQQSGEKPAWTEEQRRNLGRIQSMVYATASAADAALNEANELIAAIHKGGDDDGSDGSNGTSSPDEPGGAGGSSGGKTSRCRSFAPERAESLHVRGDLPKVSMPQRSRGGIVLDIDPVPPTP